MTRGAILALTVALYLADRSDAVTPTGPLIELFVTRLLSTIQPDGRIQVEPTFDCGEPDEEGISICFDTDSRVGFRFRLDGTVDVVDVPIIFHDEPAAAAGTWSGHYPVASREEYRRLEATVARLPEIPALQALTDCSFNLSPDSPKAVAAFVKQNPAADSRIVFLLGESAFSTLGLKGFYNRSFQGYPIGELVIINGVEAQCGEPG